MCVRSLCVCFDGVIGVSRGGEGGSSCLHCAGDLWPLMIWSEWEERDAETGRGRGFN